MYNAKEGASTVVFLEERSAMVPQLPTVDGRHLPRYILATTPAAKCQKCLY